MCIRYRIHRNLQVVHTVIDEKTDSRDLNAYSDQLNRDPDFDSAFDHMIEFSMGDPGSTGTVPAQALSHLVPPVARVQIVIVAPGDLEFGIACQFRSIYDLPDEVLAVCRDQTEALDWFGLESEQPEWGAWRTVIAPN
jgi:hypothetical protein